MSKKKFTVPYVNWEEHLSPYRKPHYEKFREKCKLFVENEVLGNIDKWERQGDVPLDIYRKAYEYGIYTPEYPSDMGGQPFEGHKFDNFMSIERSSQLARAASGGFFTTLLCHVIAIPPILHFGTKEQKLMLKEVCQGKEIAVLAISEPNAGSDVAALECTAKKDGDYYIVNGEKYWISGGMKADYFITAVRTGEQGIGGISLMIIPRTEGVITTRLPLMGHATSATAYVVFKNVKVHKSMIIGAENQGFMIMMYNFNTERTGIIGEAIGFARVCVEEAAQYARSRVTFGKPLIKHQVIRHKLAEMARQVLASHAFLEKVCYQMTKDPFGQKDKSIPRNVSLLKVQATKTLEYCAREAAQIFGGRSYVRGGRAGKIERIYRDVRAFAIYGGSEEIMLDLAVKQAKL